MPVNSNTAIRCSCRCLALAALTAALISCDQSTTGETRSPNVQTFTDATFQKEVLENNEPVLVDFWATWCGPCRVVAPTIDALADEYQGRIKVGKVDVDHNPTLSQQFHITAIPLVVLIVKGKVVKAFVGVQDDATYRHAVEAALH